MPTEKVVVVTALTVALVGAPGCSGCGSEDIDSGESALQGDPSEPDCGFDLGSPVPSPFTGEHGRIEISQLADAPDPFSPAGTGGLPTTTSLSIATTVLSTPGDPSDQFNYFARATFEIVGGPTCGPVQLLVTESPVEDGQTVTLAVVWNGMDGGGIMVQEGQYYYRATVELIRRKVGDEENSSEDGDEGSDEDVDEASDSDETANGTGPSKVKDRAISNVQSVIAIDPHGVAGRPTRVLTQQILELKTRGVNYHDLSPADRACYDASVRARAVRRSQAPVEQRFGADPDLYVGDDVY